MAEDNTPEPAGRPGRAIVIGGSLGGLMMASLLHRAGWAVTVHERAGEGLSGRGAGLTTHETMINFLERAVGVDPGAFAHLGSSTVDRSVLAPDGTTLARTPLPQLMVAWDSVYRILHDALPEGIHHSGMRLTDIQQDADSVTAIFEDGRKVTGDLLVGADGIRSTVRSLLWPEAVPRYAGYLAWRGLIPEAEMSKQALDVFADQMVYCLPLNEHILAYMVTGENDIVERGQRRLNWVWYRQAPEGPERDRLMTGTDGRVHEVSIPPHQIQRSVINEMKADARRLLAPVFAEAVDMVEDPLIQAIFDMESREIVTGRVALIGDAAFVARPHTGMGVTKAAGDAVVLTDALNWNADLGQALQAYQSVRLPFGQAAVDRGRVLGSCLTVSGPLPADHPFAHRGTNVGAVIIETATDEWVGTMGRLKKPNEGVTEGTVGR